MPLANRRNLITLSIIGASLAIGAFSIPILYDFLHVLVNSFAGGRSGVKVVLFFCYISLLGFIALAPKLEKLSFKLTLRLAYISTIGALLLSAIAQTHFSYQYNLDQKDIAVVFNLGEISSTRLLHNHTFKGIIGSILNIFGKGTYENIDAGLPFVGIIPAFYFKIGGILFLTSIVSHLLYFKKIFPYKVDSWRNILFIIIYGICSFTLLKNIIDGGIFNYETGACIIVLGILLGSNSMWAKRYALSGLSIYLLIYTYFLYIGAFTSTIQYVLTLVHLLAITSILAVLSWIYASKNITRLQILLVAFTLLLIVPSFETDLDITNYRHIIIPKDTGAIVGMYKEKNNAQYKHLVDIGNLHLYHFFPGSQTTKVASILQNNNLLDNLNPVSVPWLDCFPQGKITTYSFTLLSKNKLGKDAYLNKDFLYIKADPIPKIDQNNWESYKIHATIKPCLPRHVNILEEGLKQMGTETFILTNFEAD